MSILVNEHTSLLIQGITGSEGSRACKDMLAYGTKVTAGVTPGKGGQQVEGVPVYNSVAEALTRHPDINASLIFTPGRFVRAAALETISSKVPLINILTEHVPTQDVAHVVAHAKKAGVRVVGPSSIGIITPGKTKVGSIGMAQMAKNYSPGPIGLMSKSGGMTSEIALALTRAGFGQSTAVGTGGDVLMGTDFADLIALFAEDIETKAIVLFGEVGGTAEERMAEWIVSHTCKKPVVVLMAGDFGKLLPEGTVLGHAGAIVSRGRGSYASKIEAFKRAGVHVVGRVEDIPLKLRDLL